MGNRVLLIAPYSSKRVGGIGTWTKIILDYQEEHKAIDLIFLNTAFKFKANLVKGHFQRIIQGLFDALCILCLTLYKIMRYRPKTIHYTSSASYALLKDILVIQIARLFRIKFVIHWHFGRIPYIQQANNFEWKMFKIAAKCSAVSIVLDEKSYKCLTEVGISNAVIIPNPISEALHESAKTLDLKNKSFDIGTFVFAGHIIPAKGLRELVEACCSTNLKIKLVLIGPVNQNFKEELISIATANGKHDILSWAGEIPRAGVLQYFKNANALVLPSYTEGFPNVIIEAMASGCPIIASTVGAIEEIVLPDSSNPAGICIPPKDTLQLKRAIEEMVSNKNTLIEYSKNGLNNVLSKYTIDKVFPQYESLW